jgi:hypothetical protein
VTRGCLIAADAGKAVQRTIAAESAIFVLVNIFLSPGGALRLKPKLAGGAKANSGRDCQTASVVPGCQIELMCVVCFVSLRRRPPGIDLDIGDRCLRSGSMIVSTIWMMDTISDVGWQ